MTARIAEESSTALSKPFLHFPACLFAAFGNKLVRHEHSRFAVRPEILLNFPDPGHMGFEAQHPVVAERHQDRVSRLEVHLCPHLSRNNNATIPIDASSLFCDM